MQLNESSINERTSQRLAEELKKFKVTLAHTFAVVNMCMCIIHSVCGYRVRCWREMRGELN